MLGSKTNNLKKKNNKNKSFKFIDLFAGIGGFRIPFDELGGECVFTSEFDKFSQVTYEENFGEKPSGDITKINEKDIPSHDLLLGGFPCQAFSNAGLKKGFEDTRGTLFFDIARILKYHKPKAFILENVKGLKSHDKGNTLKVIVKTLNKMNYNLFIEVLNAKNFGLPQNRERIFIVGLKESLDFIFPEPSFKKTRLGEILEKRNDNSYTISDKIWASHQARKEKARTKGYGFGYSLFDEDSEYTSTISTRYYKDGSEILIKQENNNPRMLTPREAARLQGFPEDFKIPVSNLQAYKQFGNAVPVNVIRALANEIIRFI
ncbi:MAG: DNA (cytosine-5-)-methyltransferase [Chloroflexi bacterium]|nr:DNA (cytosine-5-)-methyltransferase [Chloroflexota bacterium]